MSTRAGVSVCVCVRSGRRDVWPRVARRVLEDRLHVEEAAEPVREQNVREQALDNRDRGVRDPDAHAHAADDARGAQEAQQPREPQQPQQPQQSRLSRQRRALGGSRALGREEERHKVGQGDEAQEQVEGELAPEVAARHRASLRVSEGLGGLLVRWRRRRWPCSVRLPAELPAELPGGRVRVLHRVPHGLAGCSLDGGARDERLLRLPLQAVHRWDDAKLQREVAPEDDVDDAVDDEEGVDLRRLLDRCKCHLVRGEDGDVHESHADRDFRELRDRSVVRN